MTYMGSSQARILAFPVIEDHEIVPGALVFMKLYFHLLASAKWLMASGALILKFNLLKIINTHVLLG